MSVSYGASSKLKPVEVIDMGQIAGNQAVATIDGQLQQLPVSEKDWVMSRAIIRRLGGRAWNSAMRKICEDEDACGGVL